MRSVVAGAQGQIARALCERGPASGVEVAAIGRPGLDLARERDLAMRVDRDGAAAAASTRACVARALRESEGGRPR
jgi:dTDP-4-dehydrorhamnose reductase